MSAGESETIALKETTGKIQAHGCVGEKIDNKTG
jgi:hypothetical protein